MCSLCGVLCVSALSAVRVLLLGMSEGLYVFCLLSCVVFVGRVACFFIVEKTFLENLCLELINDSSSCHILLSIMLSPLG